MDVTLNVKHHGDQIDQLDILWTAITSITTYAPVSMYSYSVSLVVNKKMYFRANNIQTIMKAI
jgi:hypothetical protein